jgi:hypothetical protein
MLGIIASHVFTGFMNAGLTENRHQVAAASRKRKAAAVAAAQQASEVRHARALTEIRELAASQQQLEADWDARIAAAEALDARIAARSASATQEALAWAKTRPAVQARTKTSRF